MSHHTPCKLDDRIICLNCGRITKVRDLIPKNGKIPTTKGGQMDSMQYVSYHCVCNLNHIKVFDRGDGNLQIPYLARAEKVPCPPP